MTFTPWGLRVAALVSTFSPLPNRLAKNPIMTSWNLCAGAPTTDHKDTRRGI